MLLKNNKTEIEMYYCRDTEQIDWIEVSRTWRTIITVKRKPMKKVWLVFFHFSVPKFSILKNILFKILLKKLIKFKCFTYFES